MTIEEYRELKEPGYSILSKLSNNPRSVKNILDGEKKKTKSLDFGTLIDVLLTDPESFDSQYYIMQTNLPTDSYLNLVKEYIRLMDLFRVETGSLEEFNENTTILQARINTNFQSNWKDDTVIKNFHIECDAYLDEYEQAGDKTMINLSDKLLADKLVDSTKSNEFAGKYFIPSDGIEIIFQQPITFEIEGKKVKSLPDEIYINHNTKMVEPIDIKTYSESFLKNYFKYKYYYQAAIYTFAIEAYLIERGLGDYGIMPFKFIAIDSSGYEYPMIYQISENDLKSATWGGIINNKDVVGWLKLLEDFNWHMTNDKWDYPREVYEKGFKLIT